MRASSGGTALLAATLAVATPRTVASAPVADPADEVEASDDDEAPGDDEASGDDEDADVPEDAEALDDVEAPEDTGPDAAPTGGRSVWASDGPTDGQAEAASETASKAGEDDPRGRPIGGYLDPNATKELPPPDGEKKLIVAYILLPLGTLATVTGALSTWATEPAHCQERLGKLASRIPEDDCPGLYKLNIVRTTYGSLMIVTGAVLLGLGLRDRKRHREWVGRHGARLSPWIGPRGAGVGMSLRF